MSKPVIICIDDEPAVLERLEVELKQVIGDSCLVEMATGGEEALGLVEKLQQAEYDIALVLTDPAMPDMPGGELLKQLHRLSPQTLNILVSDPGNLEAVSKAIRYGRLYRYLEKPWNPEELCTAVLEAMQTYLQERKLKAQNTRLWQTNQELSELYQQVQKLNVNLEQQVQERTAELQRSLQFEALLKRITDKVRDSLDESHILQTAVQELTLGLNTEGCDVALYNADRSLSTISYEFLSEGTPSARASVIPVESVSERITQLLRGEAFQFCLIAPDLTRPIQKRFTILACPIVEDQNVLGDMWLFRQREKAFSPLEIRLVQQVANQCAIALRQSRLFQTTQQQVQELERLNQQKDDFLSSASHELRSPMANIKMATQMLEVSIKRLNLATDQSAAIHRYFQILKDECKRETDLINDLLDLARLESGTEPLHLTPINLKEWLPEVIEPFIERTRSQQQQLTLDISAPDLLLVSDPSLLGRALTELIHNACKYTPSREAIRVMVREVKEEHPPKNERHRDSGENLAHHQNPKAVATCSEICCDPQHLPEHQSSKILITVANSGVEIPVGVRDRIFDRFYRLTSHDPWKQGGTGLGLALVKKQVEALAGTITLDCEPGWTRFMIQLTNLTAEEIAVRIKDEG